MTFLRNAEMNDREFWMSLDIHITDESFIRMVQMKQGYLIYDGERPVGILYGSLFWDRIPFLNLLCIRAADRGKGYGRAAMNLWEEEMRQKKFLMTLISTQVDETAQHFYRKLGYTDCGCLILENTPICQPMEMFMYKRL